MSVKPQSPLAGPPYTRERRDSENRLIIDIVCRAMTPGAQRVEDEVMMVVGCVIFWAGACSVLGADFALDTVAGWGLGGGAGYLALWAMLRHALMSSTVISMTEDDIFAPSKWYGSNRYTRKRDHSFQVLQHDKAIAESIKQEKQIAEASLKGKVLRPKKYHQRSWHIVLYYGRTRVDLCTVYGEKDASAIFNRLVYVDQLLDERAGILVGRDPEHQFRNDAGDL